MRNSPKPEVWKSMRVSHQLLPTHFCGLSCSIDEVPGAPTSVERRYTSI